MYDGAWPVSVVVVDASLGAPSSFSAQWESSSSTVLVASACSLSKLRELGHQRARECCIGGPDAVALVDFVQHEDWPSNLRPTSLPPARSCVSM